MMLGRMEMEWGIVVKLMTRSRSGRMGVIGILCLCLCLILKGVSDAWRLWATLICRFKKKTRFGLLCEGKEAGDVLVQSSERVEHL